MNNVKIFKEFEIFLLNFSNKIKITSYSLNEIIDNGSDEFSKKLKLFKGNYKEFCLNNFTKKSDVEICDNFFKNLGKTDKNGQLLLIETQLEICKRRILEENEQYKEKSKINLVFYSFIGIALVMICI